MSRAGEKLYRDPEPVRLADLLALWRDRERTRPRFTLAGLLLVLLVGAPALLMLLSG